MDTKRIGDCYYHNAYSRAISRSWSWVPLLIASPWSYWDGPHQLPPCWLSRAITSIKQPAHVQSLRHESWWVCSTYSGTCIKQTPLGSSLLGVIERWSSLRSFESQPQYALWVNTNEFWIFANCFSSSYKLWKGCRDNLQLSYHDCFKIMLSQQWFSVDSGWLHVRSGRLFSIAKADWGLESCSLYGVERWPFLRGCFTLKSMVVSIRTWVLGRFIAYGGR